VAAAWRHESSKLQAVVFKPLKIIRLNIKGLDALLVFQFKRSLRGPVLNLAEDLHLEYGVLNKAPVTANLLALSLSSANVALVLHFNEVDLCDDSKKFDDMPDYVVSWDHLKEGKLSACLEVVDLFTHLPDQM